MIWVGVFFDPYSAFSKLLKWRTRRIMFSFRQFSNRSKYSTLHDCIWAGSWSFRSKSLIITESFVRFVKHIEGVYFACMLIPKPASQQTARSSKTELRYHCSYSSYITLVTSLSSVIVSKVWQTGPCCPRHCMNIQSETATCWKNFLSRSK